MRSYAPRPELSGIDAGGPASERYQILGRIASGAMGQIFLARMRLYGGETREVALKRIRPELQLDRDTVEMFIDEATIVSHMQHPNIVQIFELGELDGCMFIAMELVSGINLQTLGQQLTRDKRPFPPDLAVKIACDILEALDYAHRFSDDDGRPLRIVHRDVSPQNIHLSFQGEVKLLDFGISRAEGRLHQTHPGLMKGKLAYMAPEQIASSVVDGRADLFGLGAVLYETVLGRHPFFNRSDAMLLRAIVDGRPTPPREIEPELPEELESILLTALEKDPALRYQDAIEMRDALLSYAEGQRYDLSKRHLGIFLRNELRDRYEQERRARAGMNDELLVAAFQGRIIRELEAGPAVLALPPPSPPAVRVSSDARRILESDSNPTARIPLLAKNAPEPPSGELSTADIPPLQRPSMSDLLEDELATSERLPNAAAREEGERLGRYVLLRRLRERAEIEAHLAKHSGGLGYDKRVVIEKLKSRRARDTSAVEAFARVSRMMASFSHPGLATVLDFELGPPPFRVLEFHDGISLGALFARCRQLGVRPPVEVVVRLAADISMALAAMHQGRPGSAPLIHRDAGPSNVDVSRHGRIVIGAFEHTRPVGVSLSVDTAREHPEETPPECLDPGLGPEGPPTDVYSVGLALYEGLAGQAPFLRGHEAGVTRAILEEPSPVLRRQDLPPRLLRLVSSSLARRPGERPQTASALASELEQVLFDRLRPYTSADLSTWLSEQVQWVSP